MTMATKYERPAGTGMYATLRATLADGRVVTIDTQYGAVLPQGDHIPTVGSILDDNVTGCPQLIRMGGRCTCAANADIMAMADALLVEARTVGLAQVAAAERADETAMAAKIAADRDPYADEAHGTGWCNRCMSNCYGDCRS